MRISYRRATPPATRTPTAMWTLTRIWWTRMRLSACTTTGRVSWLRRTTRFAGRTSSAGRLPPPWTSSRRRTRSIPRGFAPPSSAPGRPARLHSRYRRPSPSSRILRRRSRRSFGTDAQASRCSPRRRRAGLARVDTYGTTRVMSSAEVRSARRYTPACTTRRRGHLPWCVAPRPSSASRCLPASADRASARWWNARLRCIDT